MLDLSKAQPRKRFAIPFGIKALFLCLPWALVAYGAGILQEQIAFYNNSELTRGVVVDVEPSRRPILPAAAAAFQEPDFFDPDPWFTPSFLYIHENGEQYIGGPIVTDVEWGIDTGLTLAIRYNRTKPQEAQPVNFMQFWLSSMKYILGGVALFLVLGAVFGIVDRIVADEPLDTRRNQKRGGLLKRLKLSA